jgi:phospholipid transport system substrate-binding protein
MKSLLKMKSSFLLTTAIGITMVGSSFISSTAQKAYASGISSPDYTAHVLNKAQEEIKNISLTSAAAATPSEKLISHIGDQAISFLADENMNDTAKQAAFKDLLVNNFDMKTIARFVLGRYWRTATAEQKQEYFTLFEEMIVKTYSKRFSEYSGQELIVVGSRDENSKDQLVSSLIKGNGSDIKVDWRVRAKKDGSHKIVDVIVEGVSMSVTQRSDFSSVIQRGGGNIEALLQQLRGG